eukprot:jgi/Chrzof1/475/Cz01g17050.t1
MGLLKDNLQQVMSKKQLDSSRVVSERSTQEELGPKAGGLKAEVLQRTAPSRENAMLRAEVEVLRQQNQELSGKLKAAESKLGQHSRKLHHSHSGLQQELSSLKEALQSADAEKASALSVAESVFFQMESVRQTLEDLLLQPAEVEAAALMCCWLARHWELAAHYGIHPEIATCKAAHWSALAPPPTAMVESAKHLYQSNKLQSTTQAEAPASKSTSCTQSTGSPACSSGKQQESPGPAWLQTGTGRFSMCMQASAADVLEVERGMRQLQELGVEAAVMSAMAEQARLQRATIQLTPAALDGLTSSCPVMPVVLGPDETEQLKFQCAQLTWLWSRAVAVGVDVHIAHDRADYWRWRLDQKASVRDFEDLKHGFQELHLLSVEQQLWQRRHQTSKAQAAANSATASGTTPLLSGSVAAMAATAPLLSGDSISAVKFALQTV